MCLFIEFHYCWHQFCKYLVLFSRYDHKYWWVSGNHQMFGFNTSTSVFIHFHFLPTNIYGSMIWLLSKLLLQPLWTGRLHFLSKHILMRKRYGNHQMFRFNTTTIVFIHFHFLKKTNIDESMIWLLSKLLSQPLLTLNVHFL